MNPSKCERASIHRCLTSLICVFRQLDVQDQEKVKQVHDQVNEVVLIMRENIDKVMERGTGLETLQAQSGIHALPCLSWLAC